MIFFTYYSDSTCSEPLAEVHVDNQFKDRYDILALAFSSLISKMGDKGLNPNKYFLKASKESGFNFECGICNNKGYYLEESDNGSIMVECEHGA